MKLQKIFSFVSTVILFGLFISFKAFACSPATPGAAAACDDLIFWSRISIYLILVWLAVFILTLINGIVILWKLFKKQKVAFWLWILPGIFIIYTIATLIAFSFSTP